MEVKRFFHSFVAEHSQRLDAFLCQLIPDISHRNIRRAIELGQVLVQGRRRQAGFIVKAGDRVELLTDLKPARARPGLIEAIGGPLSLIKVVFEDPYLLAARKPRQMNSLTLSSQDPPTLADCLAAYAPCMIEASPDPREAGLVQRLDFYTSGLVLAAKTREVWQSLRSALAAEQMRKSYLALVEGAVMSRILEIRHPLRLGKGKRRVFVEQLGRAAADAVPAETQVECLQVFEGDQRSPPFSLVRAFCSRARRHQVRAHLASAGHPLVGDELYGSKLSICSLPASLFDETRPDAGFFLHALSLEFRHPCSGQVINLSAQSGLCRELCGDVG